MKTIFEEMGGSYSEVGGCRLPNIVTLDELHPHPGRRHRDKCVCLLLRRRRNDVLEASLSPSYPLL